MIKKLSYSLLVLILSGFLIWEYKVNLIIWTLPKIMNFISPIQANIPIDWTEGPSEVLNKDDKRPNIILILADDMGYNDISLHNGGAADGSLKTTHIDSLAKNGVRHIQVVSPGFSADCLETLEEINIQYKKLFYNNGGKEFTYIPCLNDDKPQINMIKKIIENNIQGW